MMMLILDTETATAVSGPMLDPRPLADGRFALPERVLSDPHHADHHARLAGLPRLPAAECAWLTDEDD
jgi:hypothetical protein